MKYLALFLTILSLSSFSQSVLVVDQFGGGQYITINAALTAAVAGDTIKVMPGIYSEYLNLNKKVHLLGMDTTTVLDFNGNGVIIFSADGASVQGFKIRRNITISSGFKNILLASNIIDSSSITANLGIGGAVIMNNKIRRGSLTVTNTGTEKILIYNNEFTDAATGNTIITASGKVVISGNFISNGGTGVNAGTGVRISGNVFKSNFSYGLMINPPNGGTISDVTILSNKFLEMINYGIFLSNGRDRETKTFSNILIQNNLFNNNIKAVEYQGGVYQSAPGYSFITSKFLNNTISNCQYGIILTNSFTTSTLITVSNNIIINSSNTAFTPSTVTQSDFNCFYNNPVNVYPGTGNITSNPMFVNQTGGDFLLQSGSPCVDAGSPTPQEFDLDRTRNDMGVYGGSYSWANFFNNQISNSVMELLLSPVATAQGNTITITGSGVANKTLQNPSQSSQNNSNTTK